MKSLYVLLFVSVLTLFAEDRAPATKSYADEIALFEVPTDMSCTYNKGECPGPGWFCLNGQCVQENTGERCWTNSECPVGSVCVSGVCR